MVQLQHPNIVRIKACCLEQPIVMILLEFASDGNLKDALFTSKERVVFETHLLRIARRIAMGLRYLHNRPVPLIHRDLKTENILLRAGMVPMIADFGESVASADKKLTEVVGTAYYVAPEVLIGEKYGKEVDIFR